MRGMRFGMVGYLPVVGEPFIDTNPANDQRNGLTLAVAQLPGPRPPSPRK